MAPLLNFLNGLITLSSAVTGLAVVKKQSISPPQGCPIPTWRVNHFYWYNGSHSLDCIHNQKDMKTEECYNPNLPGYWFENDPETCKNIYNGTMVNICVTGLRSYQPWGYGPPQILDIQFSDGLQCQDQYMGYRIHDIAHGASNCGYADRANGRIVAFYGDSNPAVSTGRMDYILGDGHALTCDDGRKVSYSGSANFTLHCEHDAQLNATCTAGIFEVPVLEYHFVQ